MKVFTTTQLVENGILPEWLGDELAHTCECGCPILNNRELTLRWCMNPNCYYHMQHKADEMFKHIGVKGIGPATCLATLKHLRLKNHFQLLPHVLGEVKPRVRLWEIADMAGIHSYGKTFWEKELADKKSFVDYFGSGNYIPQDITRHKEMLIDAESYFEVRPPLSSRYVTVMLNGSVTGFTNRDLFIDKCNEIAGQYLRVRQVGKNQSASYCITQNPMSKEGKVQLARDQGIPIVHPTEFLAILTNRVVTMIEQGEVPL